MPVSCWRAPCVGSLQLSERVIVHAREDHKRVSERETVLLAKGEFSIRSARSTTVKLSLTAAGRPLLAHIRTHPRRLILQRVVDGIETTSTLLVT